MSRITGIAFGVSALSGLAVLAVAMVVPDGTEPLLLDPTEPVEVSVSRAVVAPDRVAVRRIVDERVDRREPQPAAGEELGEDATMTDEELIEAGLEEFIDDSAVTRAEWRTRALRAERHVRRLQALLDDRRDRRAILAVAALSDWKLHEVSSELSALFYQPDMIARAVELTSPRRVHELVLMHAEITAGAESLESNAGIGRSEAGYRAFETQVLAPYLLRARGEFVARVRTMGLPQPIHEYLVNRWN